MVRVKICGLTKFEDAELALEFGADALGFVYEPSSPRFIGADSELAMMPFRFSPYAVTVGVYGHMSTPVDPCLIAQYVERKGHRVSIREKIAGVEYGNMRPVVRAFRVSQEDNLETLQKQIKTAFDNTPTMHAALIDAFDPDQFGGTGKRVDWDLIAALVVNLEIPIILAGGLTPDNVAEAIVKVRPYAVDVSSGVELSPGVKDVSKLQDFIFAAKHADK